MQEQSYYRLMEVEANNIQDESVPILVNCVGYAYRDQPFRSATQREDYYLQYMDKGKLTLTLGERHEAFEAGQFVLHKAGTPYEYTLSDGEMGYYWVHFTGSYAVRLVERAGLEFGRIYKAAEGSGHPKRAFASLFQEFMMRNNGFEDSCGALLAGLIVDLSRMAGHDSGKSTPDSKSRFTQSLAYIHSNYAADIRIADLAAMEHLSISRYRYVFRCITGMSPVEYITSLRMQHACELLTTTDYTVTQIASICGYADVLYFIRLFRQKMGITPGGYRR